MSTENFSQRNNREVSFEENEYDENEYVGVVGAVGLSAHCSMGDNQLSLEHRRRGTSIGVDLCYCFLLSYPTMVQ